MLTLLTIHIKSTALWQCFFVLDYLILVFVQIPRFVDFYNGKRPHYSIGLQTPNDVHGQSGEQKKMWKDKIYRGNEQSLQINP